MQVYHWGLLPQVKTSKGVLKLLEPTLVSLPTTKISQVATCNHGFFALTQAGNVYSWGTGKGGRLGHGDDVDVVKPKKISSLKNIKSIFARTWNVGAIDEEGNVFVWGGFLKSNVPKKIGIKGKKVSFGGNFLAVLNMENQICVLGKNTNLQFGIKDVDFFEKPTVIFKDMQFSDISCGYNNIIAISNDGYSVYVTGKNNDGQLGIGKKTKPKTLQKINLPDNLKFVQCDFSVSDKYIHAGVVAESGECFLWGSNYKFKLGNGNDKSSFVPLKLKFPKVVGELICGGIHNFLMDKSMNLYSFGCGSDGRLGHPEGEGKRYLYKEIKPRIIGAIKGRVIDAQTSYYAGIALVKK